MQRQQAAKLYYFSFPENLGLNGLNRFFFVSTPSDQQLSEHKT